MFAAHIVLEAVALHDLGGRLAALRDAYRPPASYVPQIAAATDLAWFLVDHGDALDGRLVNARAAWCARTIAIARSAEQGEPVFSTSALVGRTGSTELARLIEAKDLDQATGATARRLERFVRLHGQPRPLPDAGAAALDYKRLFARKGNGFGLKTVRQSGLKDESGLYVC